MLKRTKLEWVYFPLMAEKLEAKVKCIDCEKDHGLNFLRITYSVFLDGKFQDKQDHVCSSCALERGAKINGNPTVETVRI